MRFMDRSNHRKSERGLALIESAGVMLILLSMVLGGAAVSHYLSQVDTVSEILSSAIADTSFRPLRLRSDTDGLHREVDRRGITAVLDEIVSRVEAAIEALPGYENHVERWRLDAASALIAIDESSGVSRGVQEVLDRRSAGGFAADRATLAATDLESEFQRRSVETAANGISSLAVPSALYGQDEHSRFVPFAVLVGVRLILDQEHELFGSLFHHLEGDRSITARKVLLLRGEFQP